MSEMLREQTVGSLLRWAAEQAPGARALVEGSGEPDARTWTYAELLSDAERAARSLLGRFDPGERIAVWANNIPEWVVLEMATALAGMTLVTVNPALRPAEVRHVLQQSRAAGIFLLPEYRGNPLGESLASVRPDLPELREAVLFPDWPAFLREGSGPQVLPVVSPNDPAQIQFTSGTTGRPKGAVLHHKGIVNNARLSYRRLLDLQPGDTFVNGMPLFHTAGCVLATLSSIAGLATHVLLPAFDPELQLRMIEAEHGKVFAGVPTMLQAMLDHPSLSTTDLSSVRFGLSGGALTPPQLVERVEAVINAPLLIVYGQTEASPGITMTTADDSAEDRRTTVGRPLPGVELKIVDPVDRTVSMPTGEVGELCTRGYHVMTGYFGEAARTAEAIDDDGWLYTGDLASLDERGYCRIAGRQSDMIIRGGENIYPREIEHLLLSHPQVADVAVLGVPDPVWGEQVAAVVVPATAAEAEEQILSGYVRDRLAPYKVPRMWRFVDRLPLNSSGKVQKSALRDQLSADQRGSGTIE
uniref:AMP-binding protein n=1 Tax=Paractinoplanes polyasparticus TaxID=2856853 RepID=UPI001C85ECD9|nr:AMP-binding protein [Actinoplanes polyasparticus]